MLLCDRDHNKGQDYANRGWLSLSSVDTVKKKSCHLVSLWMLGLLKTDLISTMTISLSIPLYFSPDRWLLFTCRKMCLFRVQHFSGSKTHISSLKWGSLVSIQKDFLECVLLQGLVPCEQKLLQVYIFWQKWFTNMHDGKQADSNSYKSTLALHSLEAVSN